MSSPDFSGDDGKTYGFSRADHKRVSDATRRVERRPQDFEDPRRKSRPVWTPGLIPAVTGTTNITSTTPGNVTIQVWDDTLHKLVAGDTMTAHSGYGSAITPGTFVWLGWYMGQLFIVAADCS